MFNMQIPYVIAFEHFKIILEFKLVTRLSEANDYLNMFFQAQKKHYIKKQQL